MFFIGFPCLFLHHSTTCRNCSIYQTISQAKPIKFIIKLLQIKHLFGQLRYLSKNGVFKSRFFVKVRQHGQQLLYLHHKVPWILCKMVGDLSFSEPYLCIESALQSPPKICPPTLSSFQLPIPPLLVHKITLTIGINTAFLYTSGIFPIPIFT